MLIYAAIRLTGLALTAVALRHGNYRVVHWSLLHWLGSADGHHYMAIAAHGYTYPAGRPAGARRRIFLVPRVPGAHRRGRLAARRDLARGRPGGDGRRRAGHGLGLVILGLVGYLGYVAMATHRLDGWFWIENHTCHMVLTGASARCG
jgi:hypothetical protein